MGSHLEYAYDNGSGGELVCSLSEKSGSGERTVHYFYLPEESLK